MAEIARLGVADGRARRGRRRDRRACAHGAAYAGFLDSRPGRGGGARDRLVIDTARRTGVPGPRRAPQRLGCRAGAAGRPGRRRRRHAWRPARTTCTSTPSDDRRRRHRAQVLPADPRRRQPRRPVAGARRRATSTSSSPTTRRARADLKRRQRRLRRRLGRHRLAPARACPSCGPAPASAACAWSRWSRWMATAPARRVGLAGKGEIVVGADADLCVFAPDEAFVVDAAPAAPQEPGHGLRRAYAHRHRPQHLAARATRRPRRARRAAGC